MKYFISILCFIAIIISACNESERKTEESALADTTMLSTPPSDTLRMKAELTDSLNKVIDSLNVVSVELAHEAGKQDGEKRKLVNVARNQVIEVINGIISKRNSIISTTLLNLGTSLQTPINTLKSNILKMQRIADKIERTVAVLTIVDGALSAAITGGTITPPVAL